SQPDKHAKEPVECSLYRIRLAEVKHGRVRCHFPHSKRQRGLDTLWAAESVGCGEPGAPPVLAISASRGLNATVPTVAQVMFKSAVCAGVRHAVPRWSRRCARYPNSRADSAHLPAESRRPQPRPAPDFIDRASELHVRSLDA